MWLVRHGQKVYDSFQRIEDEVPLPAEGPIIVSDARLAIEADALAARTDPVGVMWPNNRPVSELVPYLPLLACVALVFPVFRDGRAYTQAHHLRRKYGYAGEVRATGNVLQDQFLFMDRAGFDAYEISKEADVDGFVKALQRYTVFYQPSGDGRKTVLRERLSLHV